MQHQQASTAAANIFENELTPSQNGAAAAPAGGQHHGTNIHSRGGIPSGAGTHKQTSNVIEMPLMDEDEVANL
jgi:hypothetical protein